MSDPNDELHAGSVRTQSAERLEASIYQLATELIARIREADMQQLAHRDARVLGSLSAELELKTRAPSNRYSASKSLVSLHNLQAHPDFEEAWLEGKTYLEFGCGGLNPGGTGVAMLLAGAQKYYSLDLDAIESIPAATRALYTVACAALTDTEGAVFRAPATELLDRIASFDLKKIAAGDATGVDTSRIQHIQKPIQESGLATGEIDVVCSNSVYEHLTDLDTITAELARVMKPGGLAVHAIDGYDHRYYGDPSMSPLAFLTIDSDEPLIHGCNRIPPLAFAEHFERHGFEVRGVLKSQPLDLDDDFLASLAPQFRGLPRRHLTIARARYYLRKR